VTTPVPTTRPPGEEAVLLHYVQHRAVPAYKQAGWEIADDFAGTHHFAHAVLMIWKGAGEPPKITL
jgi:hypothetical protein